MADSPSAPPSSRHPLELGGKLDMRVVCIAPALGIPTVGASTAQARTRDVTVGAELSFTQSDQRLLDLGLDLARRRDAAE